MKFAKFLAAAALAVAFSPANAAVTLVKNASIDNDGGSRIIEKMADDWSFESQSFKVADNSDIKVDFSFIQNKADKDGYASLLNINLYERIGKFNSWVATQFSINSTSKTTFADSVTFSNSLFSAGKSYRFVFAGYTPDFEGRFKYSATAVAPVPEPETYALMGLGLVGLLAARRRKVTAK